MSRIFSHLSAALLLAFASCQPNQQARPKEKESLSILGEKASAQLMKTLGSQLKAALESGGPVSALHVCQQAAQPLTEKTSQELPDLTITRTSLRVRNPLNAPDETDRQILEKWTALLANGKPLPNNEIVQTDHGPIFYKPILTQELCLKCHGNPAYFSPKLTTTLTQLYPQDQALNFKTGDLRGAFRATP